MPRRRLKRGYTRRQFLAAGVAASAAGAALSSAPMRSVARGIAPTAAGVFDAAERKTLEAALARMIPAEPPGDWSAADAGAGDYIERLLSGADAVYAGGPTREHFPEFQPLSRVKDMGWEEEVRRLAELYRAGLKRLNELAGGDFAALPAPAQDAILQTLDLEGSDFFDALFAHTMEGVYGHPVYGGNRQYVAWNTFGYAGDVHGVRKPGVGDPNAPWNTYGGYAPEEMSQPGTGE